MRCCQAQLAASQNSTDMYIEEVLKIAAAFPNSVEATQATYGSIQSNLMVVS